MALLLHSVIQIITDIIKFIYFREMEIVAVEIDGI